MPKEYKLTTIKDIFDKVPADRLEDLFKELEVLMEQAAFIRGTDIVFEFPESIMWVDDGKGHVEVRVKAGQGEHLLSIIATLGKEKHK